MRWTFWLVAGLGLEFCLCNWKLGQILGFSVFLQNRNPSINKLILMYHLIVASRLAQTQMGCDRFKISLQISQGLAAQHLSSRNWASIYWGKWWMGNRKLLPWAEFHVLITRERTVPPHSFKLPTFLPLKQILQWRFESLCGLEHCLE